MKIARIFVAVLVTMVFATVCAAQCGPARPKAATGSVDEAIIAHERQILDAIKKRDMNAFKSLVDVNGMEVAGMGARKISDGLAELFSPELTFVEMKLENPQVIMVNKDTAILTYTASGTVTMNGKTESGTSFDTTVYTKRAGKWVAIFHQSSETPKPPMPVVTDGK
jgi:hypothetical protein